METVSVLLASSHLDFCKSLESVLEGESWIEVIGTSSSEKSILELTEELEPQVIVLDYDMADDTLETGRTLLKIRPDIKIIVLSVYDYVGSVDFKTVSKGQKLAGDSIDWISKNSGPVSLLESISSSRKNKKKGRIIQ